MPLHYQHDVKISCTISCIITYQHDITISCMYVAFVVRDASPRQTSLPLVWSLASQLIIVIFILFFIVKDPSLANKDPPLVWSPSTLLSKYQEQRSSSGQLFYWSHASTRYIFAILNPPPRLDRIV